MVVISQQAIYQSTLSSQFLTLMIISTSILYEGCTTSEDDVLTTAYLNVKCDFERVGGGGCHLRESYCSNNKCVCKPDTPINIADQMCIARLKLVGEQCTFSQECQPGSHCSTTPNTNRPVCHCKWGHAYSSKSKQCIKGLKGSMCRTDADCTGQNQFCSLTMCDCMVGFEWFPLDEVCHKKLKYGEPCDSSVNCKAHDEFSACDPITKQCTCGQFLSRKYSLDELTHKCVSCPSDRHNPTNNTCAPPKHTVEYSLLDRSTMERNSHQYIYIALSMTPFIVFALIGFIYRYVNPNSNYVDNLNDQVLDAQVLTLSRHNELDFCPVQIDLNGNPVAAPRLNTTTTTTTGSNANLDLCLLGSPLVPDPPPSYEIASQDLPPSYDQVVSGRT